MFQKIFQILSAKSEKGIFPPVFLKKKTSSTPTYLIIAKDLESPHEQIFEGAVYYLCKIAASKKAYCSDIKQILETYMRKNPEKTIRSAYIKKMLEKSAL